MSSPDTFPVPLHEIDGSSEKGRRWRLTQHLRNLGWRLESLQRELDGLKTEHERAVELIDQINKENGDG